MGRSPQISTELFCIKLMPAVLRPSLVLGRRTVTTAFSVAVARAGVLARDSMEGLAAVLE